MNLIAVGIGGFIGSCARFGLTKALSHITALFPLGTLLSNVIAGIIIGFIIGLEQRILLHPKAKLLLTTGFLGGLSTFSSFSLETVNLLQLGRYMLAAGNIFLNISLSLIGVVFGMACAKAFFIID